MNNHHGHDRIHLNPDERAIVGIPEEVDPMLSEASLVIEWAREARERDPGEAAVATELIEKVSVQALNTQRLGMILKRVEDN